MASLEIKETEIESVRYYPSRTRLGKMKKSDHMNVGKDTAKQELSNTVEKTIKWYSDKAQKLSSENEMQKICILVIHFQVEPLEKL